MTMLEDDLRELFGARVQTPPATFDPAGAAIRRGRGRGRWRRLLAGGIGALALLGVVTGAALLKGVWNGGGGQGTADYSFDSIYNSDGLQQTTATKPLPIIDMPIDVHRGPVLWTPDGRKITLSGVDEVIEVIRVPEGWLYSDDFRLLLHTVGGQTMPVRDNISSWVVNDSGTEVATVTVDAKIEVQPVAGGQQPKTGGVKPGTRATGFDGKRTVLQTGDGVEHWGGDDAPAGQESTPDQLMAVYGSRGDAAIGLRAHEGKACLVDLEARPKGWLVRQQLGCAELFSNAARAGTGSNRASRSPDGRWLAVPSPTGVHLIDIPASRAKGGLVFGYSCASSPDAPAVWADSTSVLTVSEDNGVVACALNGSRYGVALPAGVSDGWALVRRFGLNS